jgi:hypothetical protein
VEERRTKDEGRRTTDNDYDYEEEEEEEDEDEEEGEKESFRSLDRRG